MAVVHTAYLLLFGAANWWWLKRLGTGSPLFNLVICLLPALLCAILAFTSREDEDQYRMRLIACFMMTPILLLFWSSTEASAAPGLTWPAAAAAGAFHLLAFGAFIYFAGTIMTRVPAEEGVDPVGADVLRARLLSLRAGVFESEGAGSKIIFTFQAGDKRRASATLELDPGQHEVLVTERVAADGARPVDASEASMRPPGHRPFDPTRPSADLVYTRVAQTRNIEPARLAAVQLTLTGSSAQVPAQYWTGAGEHEIVSALCAVVTRSGWTWRPIFFAAEK